MEGGLWDRRRGPLGKIPERSLVGEGSVRTREAVWAGLGIIRGFREPTPSGHGEVGYLALCPVFPAPTHPPFCATA